MDCGDCGCSGDDFFDFLVATPIWNYVIAGERETTLTIREGLFDKRVQPRVEGHGGVLCLLCFDRRARALGIEYRDHMMFFGSGCWMGGTVEVAMPL